jgi:hypothetical protein
VLVVAVEGHGIPDLLDDLEDGDARSVARCFRKSREQHPESLGSVSRRVDGACPGNRRAQSCSKWGHFANKWSSSLGVPGQKGHSRA